LFGVPGIISLYEFRSSHCNLNKIKILSLFFYVAGIQIPSKIITQCGQRSGWNKAPLRIFFLVSLIGKLLGKLSPSRYVLGFGFLLALFIFRVWTASRGESIHCFVVQGEQKKKFSPWTIGMHISAC